MASTYSPNLRLELIGTGEQQGTWGITTNTNLGTLIEEAIGGYVSVTVSNVADTTLTTNNGSADQSRNMVLNLTGTISAARNVICPAIEKIYVVKNATTGGFAVTFKVSGQTGVSIPNGSTYFLYVDGTDARMITGSLANQLASSVSITGGTITGITDLAIADGGTGSSTASGARSNLGAAASGANTDITSVALNNTGLGVKDTDGTHVLSIVPGSNLSANRTLTVTTGDAARTLNISASNVTVSTAGAALIDDADASAQRTTLGLGTMATQASTSVSISGGTITGITDLAVADGGTGASTAANARTNLGIGTLGTQNSNAVSITGGTITGITDLAVADGGTGASNAATARTNLGLGTMATQASTSVSISGGTITGITDLAVADGGTGSSNAAGARTNLGAAASGANTDITSIALNNTGLGVKDTDGTHVLSIVPGSNLTANRTFTLTTGDAARTLNISAANVTISTAGAALIDDADATAQRTTLGLGTMATQASTSVSISGGTITGITDLAVADGGTGASTAANARTNLGIGTIATQNSNAVSITGGTITGITDLAVADGGTGASDASGARTNLGLGTIATQNANNVSISGGSITGITDLALADGGTGASLSDPGANAVLGWNDTANTVRFFTAGTGITINATSNTIGLTATPTANVQTFNSSGTWTKPTGNYSSYKVEIWGAGGSGGRYTSANGGSGGGGGGYWQVEGPISDLGGTETATVGAGGPARTTTSDGAVGGSSSFTRTNSTTVTVYGGGGGTANNNNGYGGGGGGSYAGAGGNLTPGGPDAGAGGQFGIGAAGQNGGPGPYYGGGGGGGGTSNATVTVGKGGNALYGGGGGGGGAPDNSPGPGAGGISSFGGNGGAGSFDANNATSGTQPGGGGGGSEIGNSGAGGGGRVRVTVW